MKRAGSLPLALLCCCPLAAFSATEFEDAVPVELVKTFLGSPLGGRVSVYSDMPDDFPAFDLPPGFTVLGSMDIGYSQRVVLETALEAEAAGAPLVAALTGQGWIELRPAGTARQQTGFISRTPPVAGLGLFLCNDDLGNMQVQAFKGEAGSTVSLSWSGYQNAVINAGNSMSCEQQAAMRQGGSPYGRVDMSTGVMQYVPRMEMPEAAESTPFPRGLFPGGGGGGSLNDWEVRGMLPIDWPIEDVYDHFAAQIVDQGWELDSNWAGDVAAGGVWTKSPQQDLPLVGILNIVETADDNFELKFRVFSRGRTQGRTGALIRAGGFDVVR